MFMLTALPGLFAFAILLACPTAAASAKNEAKKTTDTVTIEVDYDADFEKLVAACEFSSHDSSINAKNFPSTGKGKIKREFKVFRFSQSRSSTHAIAEIELRGFRPATALELLTFLAKCPKERRNQTTALGQSWQGLVACVGVMGNHRRLVFDLEKSSLSPERHILSVRK